jgi:hypothetical protein
MEQLRVEKDAESRKLAELQADINEGNQKKQALYVENKILRQMFNVPDNFGIKIDEIKLHDKEKIEDYIKLIKVLQDDNL